MKNFKKLLVGLIAMLAVFSINPTSANAAWENSNNGWWYSQGNSYLTGWHEIGGNWYLFDSNGYMKTGWQYDNGNWYYFYGDGQMAHDCYVGSYYIGSNGAWTTSVPTVSTGSSSSASSSTSSSSYASTSSTNNKSQTVYITATGKKYHSIPKCGNTKSSRAATVEEAQSLGLTRCSKC